MKNLFLIALVLTNYSFAAEVCPSFAGKYLCNGNSKDFDGEVEIRQVTLRTGVTKYYLPVVSQTPGNPVYEKIADGVSRSKQEETHMGDQTATYRTDCISANELHDSMEMASMGISLTSIFRISADKKTLTVLEKRTLGAQSQKDSAVCKLH